MISNLKKVTIALEGVANATASSMPAENGNGDDEEYEGTSLTCLHWMSAARLLVKRGKTSAY